MAINLSSLKTKENLNDKIWNSDYQLNPKIRKRLMRIATDFFKDLKIPLRLLEDITFTGSLANYNWSKFSDIDLHLVIDFSLVDENINLVDEYFKAKKNLWNNRHDIEIYNFDVEVYIQNTSDPHFSTGVYSIKDDAWLIKPYPNKPFIDKKAIGEKTKFIMQLVDRVVKDDYGSEYKKQIEDIEDLSEKIKKMRACGLESGGEYSVENLTFKLLRRNGCIDKLRDKKLEAYDKMMSIE